MEHTTLHLLYSRFWHKFLYDIGVVPTKEPYQKRTSHGMILGEGGEKMSKSRGNVVNPNDIVDQYGADTMRLHIMFIGDFEKAVTWSNEAVKGSKRFLDRVWNLGEAASDSYEMTPANEAIIHKTIKKVTEDIDELKMNTAISAMMTMVNEFYANGVSRGDMKYLLLLLSPFAPHEKKKGRDRGKSGAAHLCGRQYRPLRPDRCAADCDHADSDDVSAGAGRPDLRDSGATGSDHRRLDLYSARKSLL